MKFVLFYKRRGHNLFDISMKNERDILKINK